MNPILLALGAGLTYIAFSKKSKKSSITNKEISENSPPIDAPKINEENIYKYYSKDPIYLKDIPFIYSSLNENLKEYYDPQTPNSTDKAYIYLDPTFASAIWTTLPFLFSQGYMGDDKIEADKTTKKILMDLAGDVYWKESLIPYIAFSPFYYVWISVNYLIRVAWANYTNADWKYAPGAIEL